MRRLTVSKGRLGSFTSEQIAEFWRMGDVNLDGVIDDADMELLNGAFGSVSGDAKWIPNCDLNRDGKIDMLDIAAAAKNYGKDIWSYFSVPRPLPEWLLPAFAGIIIGSVFVAVMR
jgi:hypothetical protein